MNSKVPFARHNLHSKIRPSEMKPNLFGLIHKAPSTSSSKISTRVQKTASTVVSEDTFCCSSCPRADSKSRSNRRSAEVFGPDFGVWCQCFVWKTCIEMYYNLAANNLQMIEQLETIYAVLRLACLYILTVKKVNASSRAKSQGGYDKYHSCAKNGRPRREEANQMEYLGQVVKSPPSLCSNAAGGQEL